MSRKKVGPTAFTTANAELEQAIRRKQQITARDFEDLAQARARAIQDALLGPRELEPTRVFLLGANTEKPVDGKVRIALSLK